MKLFLGYFWWGVDVDNKDREIPMSGAGGKSATIYKTKNLIVVITAESNTGGNFQLMEGGILERIESLLK